MHSAHRISHRWSIVGCDGCYLSVVRADIIIIVVIIINVNYCKKRRIPIEIAVRNVIWQQFHSKTMYLILELPHRQWLSI